MTPIDADGYQRISIKEGAAPFLMGKVTDKAGLIITSTDVSTVKATITNITSGATVLDQVALTKSEVWFDTYQTVVDDDGDTVSYNFGWQTLATYFSTTTFGDDAQFKVEVWVTPVSGQPLPAGWWIVTVKNSIVPIPT